MIIGNRRSKRNGLPKRQMDTTEYRIMWNFLNEVWYPDYPPKYRNNDMMKKWLTGGRDKFFLEAVSLVESNSELDDRHKFILNALIPKHKIDGRDEFLKLYKVYKDNINE
jgi:hypothetical protein